MIDRDGGYRSRKMVMAYVSLAMIAGGFAAVGHWPELQLAYSEFIMGVLAGASIYTGGNTLTKWINAKHTKKKLKGPSKAPSPTQPPVEPPQV